MIHRATIRAWPNFDAKPVEFALDADLDALEEIYVDGGELGITFVVRGETNDGTGYVGRGITLYHDSVVAVERVDEFLD